MDNVKARLIRCFQVVFPDLPEKDIPQATSVSVKAWDSVATVTLISMVEEEFGLQIDLDDVEQMGSFEGFLKYLQAVGQQPKIG